VTGYERITNEEIVEAIDDMYQHEHRILTNFFYTTLKLKAKRREGGKITKKHERAQTPYQRLLESDRIPQETKDKLKTQYAQLNPAELQRNLQKKLRHIQSLMKQQKEVQKIYQLMKKQRCRSVTLLYHAMALPKISLGNS